MRLLMALSVTFAVLAVTLFVLDANQADAQATPPEPVPARVGFVKSTLEFGVVPLNDKIEGTFTIVNTTPDTITFDEVRKSCSCAEVSIDKKSLPTNDTAQLKFVIRTGNRRGLHADAIMLPYQVNGVLKAELIGAIKYHCKGVFEVEPPRLVLTPAQPEASFTITVDAKADKKKILGCTCNVDWVIVDTTSLPTVKLRLDAAKAYEKTLDAVCTVHTDNIAEEAIKVPLQLRP
jgi:hypothetical protein